MSKTTNVVVVCSMNVCGEHNEHLEELLTKLPTHLQMEWLQSAESKAVSPYIADFSSWLISTARIVGRLPAVVDTSGRQLLTCNSKPVFIANTHTVSGCILCKEEHKWLK